MKKLPLLILLFFCFQTFADKLPSIAEKTASFKKYEGFMNYWWDEENGKVWLEVSNLNIFRFIRFEMLVTVTRMLPSNNESSVNLLIVSLIAILAPAPTGIGKIKGTSHS